jgi:DNA invertase Pin-like site-specific DNA recombinase
LKKGRWPGRTKALALHGDAVAILRAAGVKQTDIVRELGISRRTVQRICAALDVHRPRWTKADLERKAEREANEEAAERERIAA